MQTKRVLIVDDEEQIVDVLEKFLKFKGFDVYTAADGAEAVEKVKAEKPSLVLLDIVMPGANGIDALIKIKEIDPRIGVIMMSALSDNEHVKEALRYGAYDFVTKPFDLRYIEQVLMSKIAELANSFESAPETNDQ